MVRIAFLLLEPSKPISVRALHKHHVAKSLAPTPIGKQLDFHPLFLQPVIHLSYFSVFRSRPSSACSSQSSQLPHYYFINIVCGKGVLVLFQNSPLIPRLLPMTEYLLGSFSLFRCLTSSVKLYRSFI